MVAFAVDGLMMRPTSSPIAAAPVPINGTYMGANCTASAVPHAPKLAASYNQPGSKQRPLPHASQAYCIEPTGMGFRPLCGDDAVNGCCYQEKGDTCYEHDLQAIRQRKCCHQSQNERNNKPVLATLVEQDTIGRGGKERQLSQPFWQLFATSFPNRIFENGAKSLYSLFDHWRTRVGKVQAKGVVPGIPNMKINSWDKGYFLRQSLWEQLLRIEMWR